MPKKFRFFYIDLELEEKLDMIFNVVVAISAYTWGPSQDISHNLTKSKETHSNEINKESVHEVGEKSEFSYSECPISIGQQR